MTAPYVAIYQGLVEMGADPAVAERITDALAAATEDREWKMSVDERFVQMGQRLESLEGRVMGLDRRLARIEGQVRILLALNGVVVVEFLGRLLGWF